MTQQTRKSIKKRRTNRGHILLVAAGVILVILAAVFALRRPAAPATASALAVKGAPSIQADQDKVDLGDRKLGSTADVSFTVTNHGDQPLRFTKAPYVEVKEGC